MVEDLQVNTLLTLRGSFRERRSCGEGKRESEVAGNDEVQLKQAVNRTD